VWPDPSELRIGLGCMRLPADQDGPARDTIAAAAAAGITVFDTAHAYGPLPGANERLLAGALRACGAAGRARIVTKGGMTRAGRAWVPDGRAKTLRSDCEASLAALDGLAIDLWLLHAPDPRVPWPTSVRAAARLVEDGLVSRVGLSNVSLGQLEAALALAPIAAVEVALSVLDDRAVRGGVVSRCAQAGIAVVAHSPLGGVRRAARLVRDAGGLSEVARGLDATPAEVALAWLLGLSPAVVAIPGARRPQTARSAARAGALALDGAARLAVERAFGLGGLRPGGSSRPRRRVAGDGDAVIVMGIPGAGKSRVAGDYAARGYMRLNRDERGGSLPGLARALDEALAAGARRVVLDNSYLTRASRSRVVEVCERHGLPLRCVWLDTPLAAAQVNLVGRLLSRFGRLPGPEELSRLGRREPGVMAPTSQMRALRELEPPSVDEGLASLEHVPFVRPAEAARGRAGVFVAAAALGSPRLRAALAAADGDAPHLLFDWIPGGSADDLAAAAARLSASASGPVSRAVCPHGGGPPRCWCRPPLPGLVLAFAFAQEIDVARSIVIGARPAHRTLASAVGARYVDV
jgi:aryl-alcohol dehydrogenase-like predicted oxidoreductase